MANEISCEVNPEYDGKALRDVLRSQLSLSTAAVKRAKWQGQVLVNAEPAHVDRLVRRGDSVRIIWPEPQPVYQPAAYKVPLRVLYEDTWLMVIDKQAPMASQASENHPDDTLENALFAYLGCPADFIYRPVNRLDKVTSGLMVIARDGHTQALLQRLLHTDKFVRKYLAVVEGVPSPASGIIDKPIAKEDAASVKRVISTMGKPSLTRYYTIRSGHNRSLVSLQLETGRTHQIRVHMASIGCPVSGDFLYGHEMPELPGRCALHSSELTLTHPHLSTQLTITSPLPEELEALL